MPGIRIFDEIEGIGEVKALMEEGVGELNKIEEKNEAIKKLIALGQFIANTCKTAINAKELYINIQKLNIAENAANASTIIDKIEEILLKERQNVLDTMLSRRTILLKPMQPALSGYARLQTDNRCTTLQLHARGLEPGERVRRNFQRIDPERRAGRFLHGGEV